jgi:hypothetical protein
MIVRKFRTKSLITLDPVILYAYNPTGFSGSECKKVGDACYPGACGLGKCSNTQSGYECACPFGKTGEHLKPQTTLDFEVPKIPIVITGN